MRRVCEASAAAALVEESFAPAIVRPDPAAPINLVEEPVHDDEQHDDGEEACGGLQVECGDVVGQCAHDADGDHPGDKGGEKGEPGAPGDRPAEGAAGAGHAGGDGGEDENALKAFAKDEDADVEYRQRRGWCWRGWDRASRRS